jgi:hypothetical protein
MLMQHKMHFGRRSPHQPNPQQNYYLRQRKAQQQRPVPDQVAASCHALDHVTASWPAPGSEDTELDVLMELEVGHGETKVHARVQA